MTVEDVEIMEMVHTGPEHVIFAHERPRVSLKNKIFDFSQKHLTIVVYGSSKIENGRKIFFEVKTRIREPISTRYRSPNRVNHVFGHISAKNYPTVCFLGLHMLFCHPGHFIFYNVRPKSDSFTSKS